MSLTSTQLMMLVTPVVAVLIGVMFLDEQLSWRIVLGGLGIFPGIGIIIFRRRRQPQMNISNQQLSGSRK